jgi:hypothetical protein
MGKNSHNLVTLTSAQAEWRKKIMNVFSILLTVSFYFRLCISNAAERRKPSVKNS